ncbi:hypothetical protein, partial [Dubosiella newyorkensis]
MLHRFMSGILATTLAFGMYIPTIMSISAKEQTEEIKKDQTPSFEENDFEYWTNDSKAKQKLVDFVKNATNPNSKDFIPIENRIAVFDMDGTLLSETNPYYFEWMMFFHRVLDD